MTSATASAGNTNTAPAAPVRPSAAARARLAALVVVAVYPLITAIIYGVAPLTEGWPVWQRNFVIAPLMVVAMIYLVIPTIQRRFGKFIATGKW
jgi:antibiotic biosynthesis monooxygenase (ABM) superfamily enzyme